MAPRWLLIITIFAAGFYGTCWSAQEAGGPPLQANNLEANLTRQQKINRASLLEGASDQIRVDAAIELLLSDDKLARQVLIEALKQTDNTAAQAAVCKALAQSRSWLSNIHNKTDFIEPLFVILLAQPDAPAKLSAEAMVIFDYKQVGTRLEKIAADDTADSFARTHAIYALKLRPEKAAIFALIKMLDDKNKQVADAAALALQDSLGIPVGTEPKVWEQIAKELDRKSPDEFIRDRLVRQEVRVHQLEASLKRWQSLYTSALDSLYKNMNDDTAKTAFLAERLSSDEPAVQLWALKRVSEWRMGNKPLPQSFGPILLSLISANDAGVRLETAKLLALTSSLNPSEQLLKQLQVEKEDDVRLQVFVALGEAYKYGTLNPDVKISETVRKQTLEWSSKYLSDDDPVKAQKGAEVLGKILADNNIDKAEMIKYLTMLVQRYKQDKAATQASLRAALLGVMAGLCGPTSPQRAETINLFEPLFTAALTNEPNIVREAAVAGLIKVDEPKALATFAAKDFINDPSATIRTSLMELAGRIGGPNDLTWLTTKINSSSEGESAWRATMEIFKRSESAILAEWIGRFEASATVKLSPERKAALLGLAEQKAVAENNTVILTEVRRRLADLYNEEGQFDNAAKYYGMLVEGANGAEREQALCGLLDVRLKARQFGAAAQLVANRLIEKDLDTNDIFTAQIGQYLSQSGNKNDRSSLLKSLTDMEGLGHKPKWQQLLSQWRLQYESSQPEAIVEPNQSAAVLSHGKF